MKTLFINSDNKNIYQNNNSVTEVGCKGVTYKGKKYTLHTYQDKHSRGAGFKFGRGLLATLATVSLIGIIFFNKQVIELWKEAVSGLEKYKVYVRNFKNSSLGVEEEKFGKKNKIEEIEIQEIDTGKKTKYQGLSKEDTLRVINRGNLGDPKPEEVFNEIVEIVEKSVKDVEIQRGYFKETQHPRFGFIETNKISMLYHGCQDSDVKIYDTDTLAAIRLMVLRGDAAFMAYAGFGFYVGLDDSAKEAVTALCKHGVLYDREDLINMDKFLLENEINLEKKNKVKTERKDLLNKISKAINVRLYYQAIGSSKGAFQIHLPKKTPKKDVKQILDQLVQQGDINSYNMSSHGDFYLKIFVDDPIDDIKYRWVVWKDQTVIQAEQKFKKENKVELSSAVLQKFTGDVKMLNSLIDKLNSRVKAGPYTWYFDNAKGKGKKILKFLKENGVIHDFSKGWNSPLKIFVKPEDMI